MTNITELSISSINRALSKLWYKLCCLTKRVDTLESTVDNEIIQPQVGNRLFLFYNFS